MFLLALKITFPLNWHEPLEVLSLPIFEHNTVLSGSLPLTEGCEIDFSCKPAGGSILSTRCSETYETKTALMSLFGLPLWYFSQSPRVVIQVSFTVIETILIVKLGLIFSKHLPLQPDVYPGNCWAFKGSQGYLVIRLSLKIVPTSFCLEHIPKTLSPTGNITSAPRDFTVFVRVWNCWLFNVEQP